jgi:hypothetical protein
MNIKLIGVFVFFLGLFEQVHSKTYFFEAPPTGTYASDLASALQDASSGDVFVLSTAGGRYTFNQPIVLSKSITIKSNTEKERAIINWDGSVNQSIFTLKSGTKVEFIHLALGDSLSLIAANLFDAYSESNSGEFSIKMHHCLLNQICEKVIQASYPLEVDQLYFENCYVFNSALLKNTTGVNNVLSINKLELQSCVFANYDSTLFFVSDNANVSCGEIVINHCVFDSIALVDQIVLNLQGQSSVSVLNSVFSNSVSTLPFAVNAGITFDYCNFYHCNDLGNATGSNCYYYNPIYNGDYFVTNASLASKGSDGKNLGPLSWIYNETDTIDTGDNPHGFSNQGVWIQPTPDENGLWQSYFLKIDNNGELTYRKDSVGNAIPDFSYVGYKRGQKPHPELDVVATIFPITGDATNYIQQVIDSVAINTAIDANGCRGAILLKAGTYEVQGMLKITSDGIVLRGEGEADNGTIIVATSTENGATLINVGNTSGTLKKDGATAADIAISYIPVGATYVVVSKGHEFLVNDEICIYQQMNNSWISDLKMDQIPERADGGDVYQWVASDYAFNFERQITRIGLGNQFDTLFFYNPLVMALDAQYSDTRIVYKSSFAQRVQNCGIENMQLQSVYASATDENHAWNAVYFNRAENCWADRVTSRFFAFACANVSSYAKYITVTHCSFLEPKSEIIGSRRYSFNCDGQTSLFTYCYASEGRHDYVNGSRVCGPNVFAFCVAENAFEDIGPHHRWSMGTLFDNLVSNSVINIRDRSNFGTGHGWAGANHVLWNCKASAAICQNPWVSAKNYSIGFTGTYIEDQFFGDRPRGEWDGANVSGLTPASLYYAQKNARDSYCDFGLLSTQAIYQNDSIFYLVFNQSIDTTSAKNLSNYWASGSAGVYGNPIKVVLEDSLTVCLMYKNIGVLKQFNEIYFKVENVISKDSLYLTGWNKASLTIPDQRPVISMDYQELTNAAEQYAVMSTSKDGAVFLLNMSITPQTLADFDNALNESMAVGISDILANSEIQLSTYQLINGYYYAYAIDAEGRISGGSKNWVKITDVLSGYAESPVDQNNPQVFWNSQNIMVRLNSEDYDHANLAIYDLQGRLCYTITLHQKLTTINKHLKNGVYLTQLVIDNQLFNQKIYVQQ